MGSLQWTLLFVCLCFKVPQTEASSWTANVPSSVKGLPGSCVVIPCSFNYPDPKTAVTRFTGMWLDETSQVIYHPVESKIIQQYRNRTQLLGDIRQKDCSLMIDPLQQSDQGPFHFRIELEGYDKFSYRESKVSIAMISEDSPIIYSLEKDEVTENQTVSASCSMTHSCPASPPVFTWNHSGERHLQSQKLENGQWKITSTLTFVSTSADHNKKIQCTVTHKGRPSHKAPPKTLQVNYAPNVKVDYRPDVKEGGAVSLKCSSDAHPSASSYEWQNASGAQLHQGNSYQLKNVSRHHTEAVYCVAINTIGEGKSSPVQLNVLYAPDVVKAMSSCSTKADMVKCVCIVDSKPPSSVHFVLSDRVPPSTTVERHGSLTIGTLQAELGSYESVVCLANNTQGNASLTIHLYENSKMQNLYVIVAVGVGVILLILLLAVGVVKRCRGRSREEPTSHISAMRRDKNVELPQYAATERIGKNCEDVNCPPGSYANDAVYGNMELDLDEAVYANM